MRALRSISPRINFTRLTQWIAVCLLIAAEVIWVGLWYRTLLKTYPVASPVSELVLGGLMFVAFLIAQLLHTWRLLRPLSQALLISGLLLSLILATQILFSSQSLTFLDGIQNLNPFVVITIVIELWMVWRGVGLARDVIQPSLAWRRFIFGLLLILANMLIINRVGPGVADWGVFVGYLFVGLVAVILARVSYAGVVHGLNKNPFDRYWSVITLGFVGGVIFIATLIAALLTGQFSELLTGFATAIKLIVQVVVVIILLPGVILSFLFLYIIQPLGPWMERLFDFQLLQNRNVNLETALPEPEQGVQFLSGIWPEIIRGVIFWGIVILLITLILYFLRRRRRDRIKTSLETESENLLAQGDVRALVLSALQDAFQGISNRFRPSTRQSAVAEIRRIYARLLALGAELEIARRDSQTPNEYLRDLDHLFVNLETEIELITRSYLEVRYGETPELPEQVEQVTTAWGLVESEGKRLKAIRQALYKKEIKSNPPV